MNPDIWLFVNGKDGLPPSRADIAEMISRVDTNTHRFVHMEEPRGVILCRTELVKGVPVRHIQDWDCALNSMARHRTDVYAKPITTEKS